MHLGCLMSWRIVGNASVPSSFRMPSSVGSLDLASGKVSVPFALKLRFRTSYRKRALLGRPRRLGTGSQSVLANPWTIPLGPALALLSDIP